MLLPEYWTFKIAAIIVTARFTKIQTAAHTNPKKTEYVPDLLPLFFCKMTDKKKGSLRSL